MEKEFTKPSKYCKTTFLAFSRLVYLMCNRVVVAKQHYYVTNRNKPI